MPSADVWADYQRPVGADESVDGVGDLWGEPLNGNFGQLLKLKAKHPKLKVMISLGGWTLSKYFSDGALTAQSRRTLVQSCVDMFIKGNLPSLGPASRRPGRRPASSTASTWTGSGPAVRGTPATSSGPRTRQNFTLLLAEFRKQLDAYGREDRQALRVERLPARGTSEDLRPASRAQDLQLPRLRHRSGLRLPRHVGDRRPTTSRRSGCRPALR